jgi:plasmid maintenance system antidote protein VapI
VDSIDAVRMRNFREVFGRFRCRADEQELPDHGSQTRFAAFVGTSAAYVSHLVNERKDVGAQLARKIETAFHLPRGWMDNDNPEGLSAQHERDAIAAFRALYRVNPLGVMAELLRYSVAKGAVAQSTDLFAQAAEAAAQAAGVVARAADEPTPRSARSAKEGKEA